MPKLWNPAAKIRPGSVHTKSKRQHRTISSYCPTDNICSTMVINSYIGGMHVVC